MILKGNMLKLTIPFFGLYKVFGFYRLNPLRPLLPQSYCY